MKTFSIKTTAIFLAILLSATLLQAQDITGQWNGVLSVQGASLRLVFHISKTGEAYTSKMDSPDQGAIGIPVPTTIFDGSKLVLSIPAAGITYEGEFKTDSIVGTFKQGGLSLPMTLKKSSENAILKNETLGKEIILKTSTGNISGSLLTPENDSKDIVVLFISGSGATDRDGNQRPQLVNNSILFLAEELNSAGISSVRFDKRGVGKSAASLGREEDLLFTHYVDDVRAWIDLLSKDYKRVVVVGHSEGALVALLAAAENPNVAGVVSIAGSGRNFGELLKTQLAPEVLSAAEPFIENLRRGVTIADVPPMLMYLFRPSIQPYWISMIAIEPVVEIAKLTVPVLIINGSTDIQILPEDAALLQKAQPKATMRIIPNMNHVFKEISTTDLTYQMPTYTNPNLKNIPILSPEIIEFIRSIK